MGLLSKLKSLLRGDDSSKTQRNVDITLEREGATAGEPDTETEEAVKEPVAEETDAAASTESLVEEAVEEGEASPEERAEPAEAGAGQPDAEDMTTDVADVEPDEGDEVADTDAEADVELLKGIGPAYAERLSDAGAGTIGELAEADVDALADDIDVSPKRVGRWQERARDRLEK